MDNGVKFVLENFNKALLIAKENGYEDLIKKIEFQNGFIQHVKKTGDLYDYFLKYSDNSHQYSEMFKVLDEHGILPNEKISKYLLDNYTDEINNRTTMNDFIVNKAYTNNELFIMFNDFMSGIRVNNDKKIIAIITSPNSIYGDSWDEQGILYYTGEGKIGDQSITSSGNKALFTSKQNKAKLYLFDKVAPNKYYYRGEVYICGNIKTEKEKDQDGNLREVIKFPLELVNDVKELCYSEDDLKIIEKEQEKTIKELTKDQIHKFAKSKQKQIVKKVVEINYVIRDQIIAKDTKNRANGKCDFCGQNAPFETKDGPYLESHHVITIAEGGPDVIYNTVALCPNCHRRMHSLKDPKDFKKLADVLYNYLLSDDDKENMKKWEELFK